jgi:hypothetical protein
MKLDIRLIDFRHKRTSINIFNVIINLKVGKCRKNKKGLNIKVPVLRLTSNILSL